MSVEKTNEERELLNYEFSHLYNTVKHKSVTLNPVAEGTEINSDAEYGVMIMDANGRKKKGFKFATLARCRREAARRPNSMVVRLGRNHGWPSLDVLNTNQPLNIPMGKLVGMPDESGNIEVIENEEVEPDSTAYQLISNELISRGFYSGSRPPADLLHTIAMRYNDICPEDFAAAVVKHCEMPRISEEGDKRTASSPFKSLEEKEAWYDTPAGKAWVKEHPIPSIFKMPTPDYIHRRG